MQLMIVSSSWNASERSLKGEIKPSVELQVPVELCARDNQLPRASLDPSVCTSCSASLHLPGIFPLYHPPVLPPVRPELATTSISSCSFIDKLTWKDPPKEAVNYHCILLVD